MTFITSEWQLQFVFLTENTFLIPGQLLFMSQVEQKVNVEVVVPKRYFHLNYIVLMQYY